MESHSGIDTNTTTVRDCLESVPSVTSFSGCISVNSFLENFVGEFGVGTVVTDTDTRYIFSNVSSMVISCVKKFRLLTFENFYSDTAIDLKIRDYSPVKLMAAAAAAGEVGVVTAIPV